MIFVKSESIGRVIHLYLNFQRHIFAFLPSLLLPNACISNRVVQVLYRVLNLRRANRKFHPNRFMQVHLAAKSEQNIFEIISLYLRLFECGAFLCSSLRGWHGSQCRGNACHVVHEINVYIALYCDEMAMSLCRWNDNDNAALLLKCSCRAVFEMAM